MTAERNEALTTEIRARLERCHPIETIHRDLGRIRYDVTGLSLEARALFVTALQQKLARRLAVVVPSDASLDDFLAALRLFHRDPACVAVYPNPSLSPYQEVPVSLSVVRDEIRALGLLLGRSVDILVLPVRALFRRLPAPQEFAGRFLELKAGSDLDLRLTLERLVENGFVRTDLVGEVGEFAFRGGILDLFAPNSDAPLRLELFGDTVESIRQFDVETQRSSTEIPSFSVSPVTQFPLSRSVRTALARRLSLDFQDPIYKRDLAEKIDRLTEHGSFPGIENFVPLAVDSVSFADSLNPEEWTMALFEPDETTSAIDKYETLLRSEYESATEKGKAVYAPDRVLVPARQIHEQLGRASVALSSLHIAGKEFQELRLKAGSSKSYVSRLTELPADLTSALEQGRQQVIFVSTKGGREKVERLFKEFSIPFVDNGRKLSEEIVVAPGQLAQGFNLEEMSLSLLSEWDLFEPPTSTRIGGRKRATEAFQTDLRDLKVGDYIVHVDHGVARFRGLQRIPFGDSEREVMELEYSDGGKLLLPMESLNLIQKYSGGGDSSPRLDKLGGTGWARTKASVKKAMRDMADELLKLYATRQMVSGHAFSKDSPWQFDFEESFEFDETEDQMAAIDDLKHDMESRRPMDRLLCGDVGYGKTEVAMRAAFKSVMDGKQVAMLAPTTILAYQHYRTFLRRFASFPVSIELLSRHWTSKEQKEVVRKIESGEIDIVIGTHRLLSRDLKFKDLGVLIIDEEQRFGVGQKERLKQLKKAVDVLAMSATPIPRTLHMSMVGIRDISVIETPPKDRLAIQTAVVPFNDDFIKEAVEFEIGRGGQLFFVHNRIESIYAMKEYLEKLVPNIRVIVGHGQMDERELERAMMTFIAREHDLLLSTTIIENGIDIPACNTILINHAERFGLSQLYQLRGRVGRSDKLGFCYLLVPSERILTSDARKRLAAIQEFSDLGAGFRIAARDLEIRGAGNILGGEQSGHIAAVGFDMYTRLLEETVRELKGEKIEEDVETTVNLGIDIYIPHDYVEDENLRMMFYKKIASARDEKRLEEIRQEMRDRFGALPGNVEGLFEFVGLKQLAQSIGVLSIVREGQRVAIRFQPNARINPNKLLSFLSENTEARFTPSGVLSLPLSNRGREIIADLGHFLTEVAAAA